MEVPRLDLPTISHDGFYGSGFDIKDHFWRTACPCKGFCAWMTLFHAGDFLLMMMIPGLYDFGWVLYR